MFIYEFSEIAPYCMIYTKALFSSSKTKNFSKIFVTLNLVALHETLNMTKTKTNCTIYM